MKKLPDNGAPICLKVAISGGSEISILMKDKETERRLSMHVKETGTPLMLIDYGSNIVLVGDRTMASWQGHMSSFFEQNKWMIDESGHLKVHPLCGSESSPWRGVAKRFISGEDWRDATVIVTEDGFATEHLCASCPPAEEMRCHVHNGGPQKLPIIDSHSKEMLPCDYSRIAWSKKGNVIKDRGFWVTDRWRLFDPELGLEFGVRSDRWIEVIDKMVEDGWLRMPSVSARDHFLENDIDIASAIDRSQFKEGRSIPIGDLVITKKNAERSAMVALAAAAPRVEAAKKHKKIKKEQCSACVYKCKTNLSDGCQKTLDGIVADYDKVDDNEAIRWMSMFAAGGISFKHDRKMLVVWGPCSDQVNETRFATARRAKPGTRAARIDLDDILKEEPSFIRCAQDAIDSLVSMRKEERAVVYFALQGLGSFAQIGWDSRFYVASNERSSRNDCFYVHLDSDAKTIKIGSDTRAGTNGGRFGGSSSSIRSSDRPRFTTRYHYPFFSDIQGNTGDPIGTTKTRTHLKIWR